MFAVFAGNRRAIQIDETERRTWFLFETSGYGDKTGH
jgi:hypothetical protein